eukprot:14837207-Alexandrium_andersonii.AAC.1
MSALARNAPRVRWCSCHPGPRPARSSLGAAWARLCGQGAPGSSRGAIAGAPRRAAKLHSPAARGRR